MPIYLFRFLRAYRSPRINGREDKKQRDEHPAWAIVEELDQINEYSRDHHPGEDPKDGSADFIDPQELTDSLGAPCESKQSSGMIPHKNGSWRAAIGQIRCRVKSAPNCAAERLSLQPYCTSVPTACGHCGNRHHNGHDHCDARRLLRHALLDRPHLQQPQVRRLSLGCGTSMPSGGVPRRKIYLGVLSQNVCFSR